jgi:Pentapeptide repeats (8 copies)
MFAIRHRDSGVVLQQVAAERLEGASLARADLHGADLAGMNLRGADLRGADLRGADLRGAILTDARLGGPALPGGGLNGFLAMLATPVGLLGSLVLGYGAWGLAPGFLVTMWLTRRAGQHVWTRLNGADLRGAILTSARLVHVDLSDADLRDADLYRAELTMVWLLGTDLRGADLSGVHSKPMQQLEDIQAWQRVESVPVFARARLPAGARHLPLPPRSERWPLTCVLYDVRTQLPAGFDPEAHGAHRVRSGKRRSGVALDEPSAEVTPAMSPTGRSDEPSAVGSTRGRGDEVRPSKL